MQDRKNMVPVGLLKPHPRQAELFSDLDPEKRKEVKRSIAEQGIRDPIKVLPDYTIVAGHQRWQIAKELGMDQVPVEVLEILQEEGEYLLVADNTERRGEERDAMKKARQAEVLRKYWGVKEGRGGDRRSNAKFAFDSGGEICTNEKTLTDVAQAIGENLRTTQNLLSLNNLIPEFQEMISSGRVSRSVGYELAAVPQDHQKEVLQALGSEGVADLSVADAREIKRQLKEQAEALEARREEIDRLRQEADRCAKEKPKEADHIRDRIRELEKLNRELGRPQVVQEMVRRVVPKPDAETAEKIAALEKEIAQLEAQLAETPDSLPIMKKKAELEERIAGLDLAAGFMQALRELLNPLLVKREKILDMGVRVNPDYLSYFEVGRWLDILDSYAQCLRGLPMRPLVISPKRQKPDNIQGGR